MTKIGKQSTEKTLLRRFALLDRLPVNSGTADGLSVAELTHYLNVSGYACAKRTVERDLKAMHEINRVEWRALGVHLESQAHVDGAARWRHAASSKAVLLKALTGDDALLLSLLEQELKYFLPASVAASLSQYLEATRRVLALPGNQGASLFHERFRVIADPVLVPPEPDVRHLQEINEALLRQEQLNVQYWSSAEKIQKPYRLHPIGLVKQGMFYWLVAAKHETALRDIPVVQTFKLNRVVSVVRRRQETVARGLPTLAAALDEGRALFFPGPMLDLRIRFAPGKSGTELCEKYRETPLSADQCISVSEDGQLELHATVRDSLQLVWMLQGQSSLMRVVAPLALKEKIDNFLAKAVAFQTG
jgi:predicted DNA-binding transcriptional regulator YafY